MSVRSEKHPYTFTTYFFVLKQLFVANSFLMLRNETKHLYDKDFGVSEG